MAGRAEPKPYRVFIAATHADNQSRREDVADAVRRAGMEAIWTEHGTPEARPALDACLAAAAGCDLLIGVLAYRYGWIPEGRSESITHLEILSNEERYVFVIEESVPMDRRRDIDDGADRWEKQRKLDELKARLNEIAKPKPFKTDKGLALDVLETLQKWRLAREGTSPVPLDPPPAVSLLPDYQDRATDAHGWIEFAGLPVPVRTRIRLDDAFVELQVAPQHAMRDCAYEDAKSAKRQLGDHYDGTVPFLHVLSDAAEREGRRAALVLGDPGSGKTTHMKRLLLLVASRGPEQLGLEPETVPLLLPLTDVESWPWDFGAEVERALGRLGVDDPARTAAELRSNRRALYLLDGLDEVADAKDRARAIECIERLLADERGARVVVTCRYAGYPADLRFGETVVEYHLHALSVPQVREFVQRWFEVVELKLTPDEERAERNAREFADSLIEILERPEFRAPRIRGLTGNPLLLTAICLVHRHRQEKGEAGLPTTRVTLYEACVDVLVETWPVRRGLGPDVSPEHARQLLARVAYWMHTQRDRRRATVDDLVPVLEQAVTELEVDGVGARKFLESVRDVSGILTGWSHAEFGFLHLGFQEYLTACELHHRAQHEPQLLDELASRFGEAWWQEVTLLLLAMPDPAHFEPFMRSVLQHEELPEHSGLLDEAVREAAGVSAAPFVELLELDASDDRDLTQRQEIALRVLSRIAPEDVVGPVAERFARRVERRGASVASSARPKWIVGPADIEMVSIPAGSFDMGTPEGDVEAFDDERPVHRVTVPAFRMATTPVTNEQYRRFLAAHPDAAEPKYWADRRFNAPDQPVVGVSWEDARAFCEWAGLRLPTEAEWEYGCRAGTTTRYWSGDTPKDLVRVGWYSKNSDGRLHPVGEKPASPWSLYDMHGNVFEWCEDSWHSNYEGAPDDGTARVDQASVARVIRGGAFGDPARFARSAYRLYALPGLRWNFVGFRPARSVTTE